MRYPHEKVCENHWKIKGFERNRKQNHRKTIGFARSFHEVPPMKKYAKTIGKAKVSNDTASKTIGKP